MNIQGIEIKRLEDDLLSPKPVCFQNDIDNNAEMVRHTLGAMLYTGQKTPQYYFRNMNFDSYRWAGIIQLGDGLLELHSGVHHKDIAQETSMPYAYHKEKDYPLTYSISSTNIESKQTFTSDSLNIIEGESGSVMDVVGEPFPVAIVEHANSPYATSYWQQHLLFKGTYEGKPIEFLGTYDRIYAPVGQKDNVLSDAMVYVQGMYTGIRNDGKREIFNGLVNKENGKGLAIYWVEGEDPYISDRVTLKTEFYHLPYVDDGTVVYGDSVWCFDDIEVHYDALWGAKGFLEKPRIDRHGQSQSFGTWYVGKEPYKHKLNHVMNESMEAYDYKVEKMGFKIVK